MNGLQHLVSEFLGSHPEFIASVQWMDTPGGREMMIDAKEAGPAFCDWAVKHKGVSPGLAEKLKADMRESVRRLAG
ncbi:MAG: hypothetical protein K8U57_27975 [Planctomycetes bacterium]|nr:hypothetical protein [Planctomycetota bacterium]